MTPIGHFMCSSAVAGNTDLLGKKETSLCFLYYAFFLLVFYFLTLFLAPGVWAMHLHDWFGNATLLFFIIFWTRAGERKQYFVCLLIGSMILSSYTHAFDSLWLKFTGAVPAGMWRPHNILHTPAAALLVPAIFLPLISRLMKNKNYKALYFYLAAGYFLHIFADTITYDFQIYPFWPVSGIHFSLVSFFKSPDMMGQYLGNPLYIFSAPNEANIDGFIVYKAEVMVNFLLAALFAIKTISDRLLKRHA